MTQQNERAFQNFIKDQIKSEGGWYSQIHPGLSSDVGIPDLLTAVESVGVLPTEIKVGTVAEDNKTIWSRAIRPSQISWHTRLTGHGYLSAILIGVATGKTWRIFAVDGMKANKCKAGYIIGEDATEIDPRFFTTELDQWAAESSYTFDS